MKQYKSERIRCKDCGEQYKLSQFFREAGGQRPALWTSRRATSVEEAVEKTVCLHCKGSSAQPLWSTLKKLGIPLGDPPWMTRPKRGKKRSTRARSRTQVSRTAPTRPKRSGKRKPPSRPHRASASTVRRAPKRPRNASRVSTRKGAGSFGKMASIVPRSIAKWVPPKRGYSFTFEEGEPIFHAYPAVKKIKRLKRGERGTGYDVSSPPSEDIALDPSRTYSARSVRDPYPKRVRKLEEVPSEGGQARRDGWMPTDIEFEDTILFDAAGWPRLVRKDEEDACEVFVHEQGRECVRLPDGTEILFYRTEDQGFTSGEILWTLLQVALRDLCREREDELEACETEEKREDFLFSLVRYPSRKNTLANLLISVIWMLQATGEELADRLATLASYDARNARRRKKPSSASSQPEA